MRILAILLCALSLLITAPAWAQEDDSTFLSRFLERNLSGAGRTVTVSGFEGALSSRATVAQLTIADDQGIWLTARDVVLDWDRTALLRGRVQVSEFAAGELIVARRPAFRADGEVNLPTPEATPFSLPELPVSVNVGSFRIDRLELGPGVIGQALVASATGSADLAGGEGHLRLNGQRTDGNLGIITLDGSFVNETRQLDVNLALNEGQGGIATTLIGLPGAPALNLSIAGTGSIDDFTAGVTIATADQTRLGGKVSTRLEPAPPGAPPGTRRRFVLDLGGDVRPLLTEDYRDFFGPDISVTADAVRQSDGAVDVDRFALRAASIDLEGRVAIALTGVPGYINVTGTIRPPPGSTGPVLLPIPGGRTEVGGATLAILYDSGQGDGWTADISVNDLQRAEARVASLALKGSGQIVHPTETSGRRVNGALNFDAAGIALTDPALARAVGPALDGRVQFDWDQDKGSVRLPVISVNGAGLTATGESTIDRLQGALRVTTDIQASLADISRFSDLAGRPLSGAGEAGLKGFYEPLTGVFDGDAHIEGRDLTVDQEQADRLLRGATTIDTSVRRDQNGITLRRFTLAARTLGAEASGLVSSTATDVTARFAFEDASILGEGYGGQLTADARAVQTSEGLRVTFSADGTDMAVGQPQVDALLRGTASVRASVLQQGKAIRIEALSLSSLRVNGTASGLVGEGATDVSGDFLFDDASVLGEGYGGRLSAKGRALQTPEGLRVTLEADGTDMAVGQPQVDALLRGTASVRASVLQQGKAIRIEDLNISTPNLTATAAGRVEEGATDVTANLDLADASALGAGLNGSLKVSAHALDEPGGLRVRADGTAENLGVGNAQVNALLRGTSRFSVNALRDRDGAILLDDLTFANPQVKVDASGDIEGEVRRVKVDARLANLGLLVPQFSGPLTLKGTATEQGGTARIDMRAKGPGGIDLRAAGSVATDLSTSDLSLTGGAQLGLANPFLAPRSIQGPVRIDLRLRGKPGLDAVSGTVSAGNVRFVEPALGIVLSGGQANARLSNGTADLNVRAAVKGGGTIAVSGTIGLSAPFRADLAVDLNDAQVRNAALYTTTVDGRIALTGPLTGGGLIAGNLTLGPTEIRVPTGPLGGAPDIPDITHRRESAATRATRARADVLQPSGKGPGMNDTKGGGLRLDIGINAPGRIFVRGRGVTAELGGSIRIMGTTSEPIPVGQFKLIRGRIDFLGRRFDLSDGSITLQGSFVPNVHLAAVATLGNRLIARIMVTGPVDDPEITITSTPDLPDEEILSQIIFGRDLSSISALQAVQLASAAATLAGYGGDGVVERVRQRFALDNLDLVSDDEGKVAVRAGRYLSENLYGEILVGERSSSEVSLNLDVTRSLSLRGTLGQDGSAGVGMFFERDY